MKEIGYKAKITATGFQREVRLGALQVFVTEIAKDGIGHRGVSLCVMDALGQLGTTRFDMLPDAARVIATLLLNCADATDAAERVESMRAAAAKEAEKDPGQ